MRARLVTAAFAATILTSAALLFFVELMIGKMLLPVFGGAPAVWITCMVFFQAALLAGYAWAHAGSTLLGARRHAPVHLAIAGAAFLVLPLAIGAAARATWLRELSPAIAILALLTTAVGLPFFVLSATSPLLQRWFSHARPDVDPYPLYAASNLGSLVALLAYPAVVEPWIGLGDQSRFWSAGYFVLAILLLASAALLWTAPARVAADATPATQAGPPPTALRRARWVALAAIPSSHMLGVTTYLTTDIAPIPLLWVLPLALYLLTFIFVFSPASPISVARAARLLPFFAAVATLLLFSEANRPLWLVVPVHLGAFFFGAMACHGALAADRPDPTRLTEFYLWLSVGGVAGGLFNALVAPLAFDGLAEYPLAIVLACAFRPATTPSTWRRDLAWAAAVGAATLALVLVWESLDRTPDRTSIFLLFCLPILAAYRNLRYPLRFAMILGAIFLANGAYTGTHGTPLLAERGFFGALRVTLDREGLHRLVHGGTVHGRQHADPVLAREPIDYYSRSGPVGNVYDLVQESRPAASIAVIGLGVGEVAAYARTGETWTFYEIDPLIARIATDPHLFTYLRDAFPEEKDRRILLGDARLELESAPDASFDLMVLDAFSSDAIPLHLITREAIALYRKKLAPGGVIAFHVSNNFVDLEPILGNLAHDAQLSALTRLDKKLSFAEQRLGKLPSRWVALSNDDTRLEPLRASGWVDAPRRDELAVWTDDHSNLLRVLRLLR